MKKRKFFSFMLMGLLTVGATSMISSCKDYDDDINNLQEQIDKAALKTDLDNLSSQLSTAASTASSAASTAQQALTKAGDNEQAIATVKATATEAGTQAAQAITDAANAQKSANDAATAASAADAKAQQAVNAAATNASDIATIQTQLQNLGVATKDVVTAEKLKTSIDSLAEVLTKTQTDSLGAMSKKVDAFEGAINALYTAVSQVEIVGYLGSVNTTHPQGFYDITNGNVNVQFQVAAMADTQHDFVFGQKNNKLANTASTYGKYGATPQYTYDKDATARVPQSLIVRVNPANAKVNTALLKLVDATGAEAESVQIDSVKSYSTKLTRAGESGLWRVYISPKNGKTAAAGSRLPGTYTGEATGTNNNIRYYVAINNTQSVADSANSKGVADRYAITPQDVTFAAVKDIDHTTNLDDVTVWADSEGEDAHKLSGLRGRGANAYVKSTGTDGANNATATNTVYALNGETINVSFKNVQSVDKFYVVRDNGNASEGGSQTSDINAWNSYSYSGNVGGVNSKDLADVIAVSNGTGVAHFTVKINGQTGDEVAFRIYAVDYDGKLVPLGDTQNTSASSTTCYGVPFIVYVGNKQNTANVTGNVIADDQVVENVSTNTTADNRLVFTVPLTNGPLQNGTNLNTSPYNTVDLLDADDNTVYSGVALSYQTSDGKDATKNADIAQVKFTLPASAVYSTWKDGTVLHATVASVGSDNVRQNTVEINLTKVLPDKAYTTQHYGYEWRTGITNNPYVAFMRPVNGTSAFAESDWKIDPDGNSAVTNGSTNLSQPLMNLPASSVIQVQNSVYNSDDKDYTDPTDWLKSPDWTVSINKELFETNGISERKNATIAHNYKSVSSESKGSTADGTISNKDLRINIEGFTIQYTCPLKTDYTTIADATPTFTTGTGKDAVTHTYALVYGQNSFYTTTGTQTASQVGASGNMLSQIKVVFNSNRAQQVLGYTNQTVTLQQLLANRYNENRVSIQVLSEGKTAPDYFDSSIDATTGAITLTPKADIQGPEGVVNCHIVISAKDVFGHTNTYSIPIKMRPSISTNATAKRK